MAYVVMSDWSQPSAPAMIPNTNRFFAVNSVPAKGQQFAPKTPIVPADQPKSEMVTVVWDGTKVADVSAETTVFRGTLLNMIQDTKVIHPVTKQLIEQAKYPFVTGAIVADMQGGEPILPILDRLATPEALKAPGEMLIIDASGKLHVLDEVTDIENVRRFTIPKPPPVTPGAQPGDIPGGFDPLNEGRPKRPARGSPSS
jgi:hypothetical protein